MTIEAFNSIRPFLDGVARDARRFMYDMDHAISRMGEGERVVALCLFALALLFLMIRRPNQNKEGGSMGRQFLFALAIVVLAGYGATWIFDGLFVIPSF